MGMHTDAHIVWDWNGTLFHDVDAVIGATNAAFAELGLEPLTLERYRELYCVPVPKFYERLMGRLPSEAEWELMDSTFHRYYTEHRVSCGLAEGVVELLAEWAAAGRSQSILSMYGHQDLVPLVRGFGIEPHFVRVDGRTGPSGGSKAEHMVRHLAALTGFRSDVPVPEASATAAPTGPAVPADAQRAVTALATAEHSAAGRRISQCEAARDRRLARLIASIGGSEAAHTAVLRSGA